MNATHEKNSPAAKLEAHKARQRQIRDRAILAGLAGAVAIGLAAFLFGASAPEFPGGLQGRWTSEAAGYEGRYFEVAPDLLTIETKVGPTLVYPIVEVETRTTRARISEVLIHYAESDGATSTFRVVPRTPDFHRVTVDHGSVIWTRSKT